MRLTIARLLWTNWRRVLLLFAAMLVFGFWLSFTPGGLLGKTDAVGYAICHRITVRSFLFGERQFPLCARCSGMYLGAFVGLAWLAREWKKGGLPPVKQLLVLGLFVVAFGIDGLNSYAHFFPFLPKVYEPNNLFRLFTGLGMGLGIASVLLPVFHQSAWIDWQAAPSLTWKNLGILVVGAGLMALAMLSQNPLLLIPLAVFSTGAVVVILTLVYCVIYLLLFKKENAYLSLKEMIEPLLFGFTLAMLQILVMDLGRLWLTGTWDGFVL